MRSLFNRLGLTRLEIFNIFVLVLAILFFIYDLASDFFENDEALIYMFFESSIFTLVSISLIFQLYFRFKLKRDLKQSETKLNQITQNLVIKLEEQFKRWNLSPSEKQIAWLIIKGYSFSEIALLREVKEKTVRQQATSIYSKSSVKNRAEFSASFIDDLLSFEETEKNFHTNKVSVI